MENVYSRSEPRVLYRAPVWLRPSEGDRSFVGETRNLSRSGLFVSVSPTPPLGTEVWCELPGRPALRGRVAWVFDPTLAASTAELRGVGIEIIDRSEESSLIEELVGVRLDDEQPLEVRFSGTTSPTRATGRVTHEGIDLSTPLPFLRIGSTITVGQAGAAERLSGRIARVVLRGDGDVPRLQISIQVLPEPAPVSLSTDDERWFPEIDVQPLPEPAAPQPALAFEATPLVVASEIVGEKTERTEMVAVEPAPPVRRPARRLAGPLAVLGACAMSGLGLWWAWSRSQAPMAPAEVKVEEAQVQITTIPAETPPTVAPAVEAKPENDEVNPNARPVAAAEHPPVEAETAAAAPIAAPVVASPPTPSASPTAATPGAGWKPQVVLAGDAPTVTVPITGGTRGMSSFTMSDPPGYAIDLPRAHTEVALRSYLLHDPSFTSLWIRPRPAGGLQIRLHTARGVKVTAEASPEGVRFRRISAP